MFLKQISDKGLFPNIQVNHKIEQLDKNNLISNCAIDLDKHYSKKDTQISNKSLTNAHPLLNYR